MGYRDEGQASVLRERCDEIESALAALEAQKRQVLPLGTREEDALRTEVTRARAELATEDLRGRPPVRLPRIQVAAPCSERWESMKGDDKQRFCGKCTQTVHDLSAMTSEEAIAFVRAFDPKRQDVCVRFYQRADGRILTRDCSVGVRAKRIRKFVALGLAATAAAVVGPSILLNPLTSATASSTITQGQLDCTWPSPACEELERKAAAQMADPANAGGSLSTSSGSAKVSGLGYSLTAGGGSLSGSSPAGRITIGHEQTSSVDPDAGSRES